MSKHFTIQVVDWQSAKRELSKIRRKVFIEEQQVPEELEWDEFDASSSHLLAIDAQQNPIGCARLLSDGHIGRMAVLLDWRGNGVGNALLQHSVALARRRGYEHAILDAQCHAIPFYQRAGFIITSDQFIDAGIPHRTMQLPLK